MDGLRNGPHRTAFKVFAGAIQSSSDFANGRLIKTWRLWDDNNQPANPTTDAMPMVQVRMLAGSVRPFAGTRKPGGAATWDIISEPTVVIEVWTKGSNSGDIADIGDAIFRNLYPQDDTARKALQTKFAAVGIREWHQTSSILPPSIEAYSTSYVYGIGTYQLKMFLNS